MNDENNGKVVALPADDNAPLRRARSWIARWRTVGGGFHISIVARSLFRCLFG